jgi:hypothetical protein
MRPAHDAREDVDLGRACWIMVIKGVGFVLNGRRKASDGCNLRARL